LIVAGPFDHPHDPAWRGIFVMDVASVDQARPLVETDPGVQAGVFTPELRPLLAPVWLRRNLDLDRELHEHPASRPANRTRAAPPPNIRGYVMITTNNARQTEGALKKAALGEKVLWSGRFADAPAGRAEGGVFVLDATKPDEIRAALASGNPGDIW